MDRSGTNEERPQDLVPGFLFLRFSALHARSRNSQHRFLGSRFRDRSSFCYRAQPLCACVCACVCMHARTYLPFLPWGGGKVSSIFQLKDTFGFVLATAVRTHPFLVRLISWQLGMASQTFFRFLSAVPLWGGGGGG